jgi:ABC-type sugar transport system permease subunit
VFTAAGGGLSFLAGLGLALLLSKPFFGRGALAAAAFLPWVFPPVAVATFGRLALFSGVGPLSRAAEVLGFGNGDLLLVDQGVLLSVAVVLDVWRTAPFVALLLLAALRTIPGDVYEAARVDSALQRFFSITLPLLKPALMVVLLLRLLDVFRVFNLFRVLGADNLASLSTYVYKDVMLSQINFGLGNAAAVFVLLCAFLASLFVRHGLAALAFPYPLNYGEGPLLDQAARLTDLKNTYPADLSKPPYVVSNYPPLFVLLQAPFVWIFGPGFLYGRAISLASTVAAAGLIAATLNAFTRDKTASAACGLTFLAVPFMLHWSSLDRVDMMGLALSWGGLYAVVRRPDRRNALLVAVLFFVAAIYTRQTYALAAPLAAFAWLLAAGHGRRALALATLTVGLACCSWELSAPSRAGGSSSTP